MIYAEWILIENFLADAFLLYLTGRIWGHPPPWKRLCLAASAGALGALAAAIMPSYLGGWGMKTILPALMAWITWPLSRKQLFPLTGTLLGTALLSGGAALTLLLQRQSPRMPIWASTLAGLIIALLISAWTLVPRQLRPFRRTILCRANGVRFYGHVDTGNELREPISASPVVLLSPALAEKVFGRRASLLSGGEICNGLRLIPCRTLHDSGVLAALPLADMQIFLQGRWHRCEKIYAALGNRLTDHGQAALLPPLIPMEGGHGNHELAANLVRKMDPLAGRPQRTAGLHRRKRHAPAPAPAAGGTGRHRIAGAGRQGCPGSAHRA